MAGFGRQLDAAHSNWTLRGRMDDELLGRHSAFDEAEALYRMVGDKNTVKELRDLIAVPPKVERALCAFAKANPHEAHWIELTLKFRSRVLEVFERLVREGIPVADLPEVEEMELGASTEAVTFAPA